MEKYVCSICGYVYDPAAGDKEGNIPPGVPFDKLPDEWVCPICGAGKEELTLINEKSIWNRPSGNSC